MYGPRCRWPRSSWRSRASWWRCTSTRLAGVVRLDFALSLQVVGVEVLGSRGAATGCLLLVGAGVTGRPAGCFFFRRGDRHSADLFGGAALNAGLILERLIHGVLLSCQHLTVAGSVSRGSVRYAAVIECGHDGHGGRRTQVVTRRDAL